ncbi:hypothetical protein Vadar_017626 [Vaccinium darrowii]|uniref:Uncharacterized protein n=1 Tax=Vaccinium darrowii TaxID=229202 RepID=A0ACB7XZS3_9ERIC|nr:hypothetical protein Vadar_017626 [Vaccinium darrowii]
MPTSEENTPLRPLYVITVSPPEPDELLVPLMAAVMVIHDSAAENPHQRDKDSPLPASKKSIEAMPTVKVTESETESLGSESCAICLGEYEIGEEAKEMPCKHRFHSACIDKWLGIHGSCPVCRYEMPVEEDGGWDAKVMEEENRGRRGEGFGLAFSIETVPWGFGLSSDDDYGRSDDEGGSDGDEAAHDMEIEYDSMID